MTNEELFFETLKKHRETKNIEISEICDFTKINQKYIEAIESGEFNLLPVVYMRLFLRGYANFIGCDSSKALEDFELYTTGKVQKKLSVDSTGNRKPNNTTNLNTKIEIGSQVEPKQIGIGITVIVGIFLLLFWAGKVTNQQKTELDINSENQQVTNNIEEELNIKNLTIDSSKVIDTLKQNSVLSKKKRLVNNLPLNKNDFLAENKTGDTTLFIQLYEPFTFSVNTLSKTKLNISKSTDTLTALLINTVVPKGKTFKFNFESTINFEFLNSKDVDIKLNEKSLMYILPKEGISIRGSYEIDNSQLYLGFYKN